MVEALEDRLVPTTWFVATRSTADNFHPQNPGNNSNDGLSPATPFGDIQQAVNVASSGDRIFVAQGAYGYNAALDQLSAPLGINPAVVMIMDKSVEIYGGFNNSFTVCDPVLYHTVIDALGHRGVYVLSNQSALNFLMSGFTIEQGTGAPETNLPSSAGADRTTGYGGGMWINNAAHPNQGSFILQDMVFYQNSATGFAGGVAPTVGGTAAGGGLALRYANTTLHRVTFSGNSAAGGFGSVRGGDGLGGGLEADFSTVTGDNVIFVNNSADLGFSSGSGVDTLGQHTVAQGGAAAFQGGSATLQQVTAFGNQAGGIVSAGAPNGLGGAGQGGAFFVKGAAAVVPLTVDGALTLTDASLRSNSARGGSGTTGGSASGGAIAVDGSSFGVQITLNRVQILANTAQSGDGTTGTGPATGGGVAVVSVQPSKVTVTNSVFADNGVRLGNGTHTGGTSGGGGAVFEGVDGFPGSFSADLTFTTFAQNTLGPNITFGQALLLLDDAIDGFAVSPTTVTLTDSIIANHTSTNGASAVHVRGQNGRNTLTYNRVLDAGNTLFDNSGGQPPDPTGVGVINGASTVLHAASAGFVSPGAPNYDYSLLASSPAVNQGTPVSGVTIDIDQQPRKSTPDLGAYESPPAPVARQTVATYDPGSGLWQIRSSNSTGFANLGMFTYGLGGNNSFPVVGDWTGTGQVGVGVVEVIRTSDPAIPEDPTTHLKPFVLTWKLRTSQTPGTPDVAQFEYGRGIDIPVVGDWDGNGTMTVGIYEPDTGVWKLRNSNTKGTPDFNTPGQSGFAYGGLPGDLPVVGDWDGNGTTTVGVVERVGTGGALAWKLRDSNSAGFPDAGNFAYGGAAFGSFTVPGLGSVFGAAVVQPITGDWNGDKRTTVGVLEPNGQWLLKNANTAGAPDAGSFFFGEGQSRPLAADFAGLL
jgi:hypothetical protein